MATDAITLDPDDALARRLEQAAFRVALRVPPSPARKVHDQVRNRSLT